MHRKPLYIIRFCFLFLTLFFLTNASVYQHPGANAQDTSFVYLPVVRNPEPSAWMGPDGGSIEPLVADPSNPNVLYAGTLNAGIFKTTNKGATWVSVNNGLTNLFLDSLAIDPKDPTIVYAGSHGSGVFKTNNGGASWFPVNNGITPGSVIYTLAVNPGNHDLVYAGGRVQGTEYTGMLYKSSNGGQSWEHVLDYSDDWVYSVAVNPSYPYIVMAAVHTRGPYISYDYGGRNTWNAANPPDLSDYEIGRWRKGRAVAFDPRGYTNRAYYTAWDGGDISYSSDNGDTWRMSGLASGLSNAQIYPNGISVKPGNPDIVYLADHDHDNNIPGGVLKSTDAGRNYQGTGLSGKTTYSVAAVTGSGDTVLAGTYLDGIYRSDNGGINWFHSMSGILNSKVTGMVFPGRSTVYASTQTGGGVFRSLDGGQTWAEFNNGLGDTIINGLVMHPTNHNILFALTNSAGLRRIDLSAGSTWTTAGIIPMDNALPVIEDTGKFAPPPPPDEIMEPDAVPQMLAINPAAVSAPVFSLAFAPSNANIAYAGTNGAGVYASTNGGLSWTQVGLAGSVIRALAVHLTNPNIVYAVNNQAGAAQVSSDGGHNWTPITFPNPGLSGFAVAAWPNDPGNIYFGTSSGVFKYNGSSWSDAGLSGYQVIELNYHPGLTSSLFAGTEQGVVFRSFYGRSDWASYAMDPNSRPIMSLNFNPADLHHIFIGTTERGTLRVPIE